MNPFQFNALAIIIILVVYPFAIGFVSGLGAVSGDDYQPSHNFYGEIPDSSMTTNDNSAWWISNGNTNLTYHYENNNAILGECAYIEEGRCVDDSFSGFINWPGVPNSDPILFPHSSEFYQTHYRASLDQNFASTIPYVGTSGNGDFELRLSPYYLNQVENFEAIDSLKFDYVDTSNTYNCASHNWVNLTIIGSIEFEYQTETISFDGFSTETSNKYTHYPVWNNYAETCHVGFSFEFDFDSFESLELLNMNDGFYNLTTTNVSIDKITREDGRTLANTELPFAGIGSFHLLIQHSTVDVTQANFFLKTGTLVLTIVTFLLAIGSTPYWDPVMQSFRGRL